jgi:DNA-binding response OmpR family regulator
VQVIVEASDGVEAVRKAQELQPDLIVLDIGLPQLNGIAAAKQIRDLSPQSRILFLSQESSLAVVEEAMRLGGWGYVLKADAGRDLQPAIDAVLRGRKFLGKRFSTLRLADSMNPDEPKDPLLGSPSTAEKTCVHEVHFYSEDTEFLNALASFVGTALNEGNAAVLFAKELHRADLLRILDARGVDVSVAVREGRLITLNPVEVLASFMVDGMPDRELFFKIAGDLFLRVAKNTGKDHSCVVACGECSPHLWEQGDAEATIRVECLFDEASRRFGVDMLCGYPLSSFNGEFAVHHFNAICAEHSVVYLGET